MNARRTPDLEAWDGWPSTTSTSGSSPTVAEVRIFGAL